MKVTTYHNEIVNSPIYKFESIIENLIGKSLDIAKIELCRYPFKMDFTLIESIKLILKDLKKEEGIISNFLYNKFGFEIFKNKRRKQLVYLGSELKMQSRQLEMKMKSVFEKKEELACSIVNLRCLNESFHDKNMLAKSNPHKNRNEFLKTTLEKKIKELERLEFALLMSYSNLREIETIYVKSLETIPRNEYLDETSHKRLVA